MSQDHPTAANSRRSSAAASALGQRTFFILRRPWSSLPRIRIEEVRFTACRVSRNGIDPGGRHAISGGAMKARSESGSRQGAPT